MVPGTIVGALGYAEMKDQGPWSQKIYSLIEVIWLELCRVHGRAWEGSGRGCEWHIKLRGKSRKAFKRRKCNGWAGPQKVEGYLTLGRGLMEGSC